MAILQITTDVTGLVGVLPQIIYINTTDVEATVIVAGYLNHAVAEGYVFNNHQMACVYTTDNGPNWYQVSVNATTKIITLVANVNPGSVLLPVTIGHIATFTNTAGQIGDTTAPAIHLGNIVAGASGTAGVFQSFPATVTTGSLIFKAISNSGNFATTVSNAAMGQGTVVSIPDPGAATANFILSALVGAGTQHITSGSLQVDAGNLTAGSSGAAGTVTSFPATAANGSLIVAGVNAGGAFNTTISNGTMGQSTVYTIPDVVSVTGRFLVAATATPFTANHSVVASGTGGLIADAGYQMKVVAQAPVAGGAAAQSVSDAFCTSASMVVCTWNDTSNAVTIQKAVAGNGSFIVTSSADPGASHLNYIITKV